MGKLVVLKLGDGSFEQGFPVTLQIGEDGDRPSTEIAGKLPPSPEIPQYYSYWQSAYYRLGLRSRLEAAAVQVTNVSIMEDCYNAAQVLSKSLNAWLHSESFRLLREKLLEKLIPQDAVRVILQTDDPLLQRLPWHICNLFTRYPKAEIALSAPAYESAAKVLPQRAKLRILAILGSSAGIDIQADRVLLENLPDAEICFLVEPPRQELNSQLWSTQGWDILFFAGHSASQNNCELGRIYINQTESLTISDLKHALQTAVEHGLKLAIFNSCDGLGLARELAGLYIPQVIVMREPVPDRVAQEFLKNFLQAFAGGKSLYLSVREARERLQGWESEFPCASWLPVIYQQNPAEIPLSWQELVKRDRPVLKNNRSLRSVILSSVAVTALVMGVRYLGMLQGLELQAYDHLMRLRPEEGPDSRLLVVTVTEQDFQLPEQKHRKGSLSDLALEKLLHKLNKFKPRTIGLDIYRDFPAEDSANLATQMRQSDHLYAVCKVSDPQFDPDGVQPPPEVPPNRWGFSDVLDDGDNNMIRRQYIHLDPPLTSRCSAKYAFSLKLALHYLDTKGIQSTVTPEGYLQIGNAIFKRLPPHAGGYQTLDTSSGYQLLLNYRPFRSLEDIAPQVTLRDILTDRIPPERVKDLQGRIVLIGPTAPSFGDYWSTPYNISQQPLQKQIPGVFLQAQMISQILSAVLDRRPLIWVLPVWSEALWIWAWSAIGGILAWRLRSLIHLGLFIGLTLAILSGICFGILTKGGWVPLIPSALAVAATGGSVVFYKRSQSTSSSEMNLAVPPSIAPSNRQLD